MSKLHILTRGKHQFRFHIHGEKAVVHTSTGGSRRVSRQKAAAMWAHLRDNHGFKAK